MRDYSKARGLFGFLEFIAWCLVAVGVLVAFGGMGVMGSFSSSGALAGAIPGVALAFFGFFQLAIVQNARAAVDTAEYTQQMLQIARDQLEVSRQSLRQGEAAASGYEQLRQALATPGALGGAANEPAASGYAAAQDRPETRPKIPEPVVAAPSTDAGDIFHAGERIRRDGDQFLCHGQRFETLEAARVFVDNLDGKPLVARRESVPATAQTVTVPPITRPPGASIDYRGRLIERSGDRFSMNGIAFHTLDAAKLYIDEVIDPIPADRASGLLR